MNEINDNMKEPVLVEDRTGGANSKTGETTAKTRSLLDAILEIGLRRSS